jgi:hypothetical protein
MNNIKRLLREALEKRLPDTTFSQELKQHQYPSLSNPSRKADINQLRYRITKAAQQANDFMSTNPDDNYFNSPEDGDGFYQVELRHDGQIKTKHIKASTDMQQMDGAFRPSDVGTCKTYQNIARYCFVKAGKNGTSVGASPAEDAANKVLIIFRNELIDFLGGSSYDDGKGAEISREKMSDKEALRKQKKDLETKIGRRLSDSEWMTFLETGQEPNPKSSISTNPDANAEFEKKQAMAIARRDAALKNRGKY